MQMCKLMKLSQIFKTIFALLMFTIKAGKKTLKAYVSCHEDFHDFCKHAQLMAAY